ncbi:MAG: uroporphyrinogen decarboxylase family protein [Phycisphaerae bacterium]
MTPLTRRERLRRCYFHEELDRPAVYVRTGYPANDSTYHAIKALMAERSELKALWQSTQVEHAKRFAGDTRTEIGPLYEERTERFDDDWDRYIVTLHTPAGDLTATALLSRKGLPGMHQTYFLKDRRDAEKYLSLPMPELAGGAEDFFAADREMGDRGITEVCLGNNPGGFVADLFGSTTFAMMSIEDRDILHALCEQRMNVLLARLKFVLGLGVGPYFQMLGQEMIVPPLHGPADFDDFNVRYDKPIIDAIHNAGGRLHVHCHSKIAKVMKAFVNVGVDVLHPFEPPPMGDITARQAKEIARGRMCLEGNIQIADMYEKPPADIRAHVEQLIRDAFDDHRGLIVCPSASLYQFGKGEQAFPQVKAMVDTVLGSS